jgi:hypothetical protein
MRNKIIVSDVLDRIKVAKNLSTDTKLAAFLGLKQSSISTWKSRNSMDIDIVFAKCNDLNMDWLLTGKGEMLRETSKDTVLVSSQMQKTNDAAPLGLVSLAEHVALVRENERLKMRVEDLEKKCAVLQPVQHDYAPLYVPSGELPLQPPLSARVNVDRVRL